MDETKLKIHHYELASLIGRRQFAGFHLVGFLVLDWVLIASLFIHGSRWNRCVIGHVGKATERLVRLKGGQVEEVVENDLKGIY